MKEKNTKYLSTAYEASTSNDIQAEKIAELREELERLKEALGKLLKQLENEHVTDEFCRPIIDECEELLKQ